MSKVMQFVDQSGRPIPEHAPREGDALDVGFGGPINRLMEKLQASKQIMDIADERYPYEKTGVKKSGKLTSVEEEVAKVNVPKSIKTLKETFDHDDVEETVPAVKQLPKSIQKPTPKQRKPVQESDDRYIEYAKNGVQEEDEYDTRKAPSLTQELLLATKAQGQSKTVPDMSGQLDERIIRNSKLPDAIKNSFLKNPLTPPKLSSVLGGGKLDAITDQFRKQKLMREPATVAPVQKKVIAEVVAPITGNKREKIKAQLRPIVEELIREILREKL